MSTVSLRSFALLMLALTGAAPAGVIHVPADYPSIQEAVDAASSGDQIVVEAGSWTGPHNRDIDFGGKNLWLRSVGGPAGCEIVCNNLGRAFNLTGGGESTIQGFTIREGYVSSGDGGGALVTDGCSADFEDCRFVHCHAPGGDGGGVAIDSGTGSVAFCNCKFLECLAGSDGGGVWVASGRLVDVCDSLFQENKASNRGGGMGMLPLQVDFTIFGTTFSGNTAGTRGGGLYIVEDGDSGLILRARFDMNRADDPSAGTGMGAGIYLDAGTRVFCIDLAVFGNVSTQQGSGLFVAPGGHVEVDNGIFSGNTGPDLPYAVVVEGEASIRSSTFANHTGGALRVGNGGSLTLQNSITYFNGPTSFGGELWQVLVSSGGSLSMDYCCIAHLSGTLGGTGNVDGDPRFADRLGADGVAGTPDDDLNLTVDSPCIDAGDSTLLPPDVFDLDVDGIRGTEALPLDYAESDRTRNDIGKPDTGVPDADGSVVDIGAFEFTGTSSTTPAPWDINGDLLVDGADLGILLGHWSMTGNAANNPIPGDLNGDGIVDGADLGLLLGHWGPVQP